MESKKLIREFIITNFLFGSTDTNFSDDDSFLETSIIDSTGILELVAFVETNFGIEVADRELVPENLDSISKLASFIEKKKMASAS